MAKKKTEEPDFFSKQVAHARRFYIEGFGVKSSGLKVVCGGCEQTRPDFKIDRRNFPYYSIEFVARGKGAVVLAGKHFDLNGGSIFSYGPGISQVITTDPDVTMEKYFVDFTGSFAGKMLKKYVSLLGVVVRTKRPDDITRIFDDLIQHGLSDSPYRSILCSRLLDYLIVRIADTMVTEETKISRAFVNYQQCRQYIKDHFIKLHSLQNIADACSIDKAYLCRLFKRFDTQSPNQYLLNIKMAFAAELLHKPDTLVKEISYKLGFDNPFHFSRVFKKVFGISPNSFKQLRSH